MSNPTYASTLSLISTTKLFEDEAIASWNKQSYRTDPDALLPMFSGSQPYAFSSYDFAGGKASDRVTKEIVVSRVNPSDSNDLKQKFSHLSENDINSISNVGKALYAGSMQLNSSDSVYCQELENCRKRSCKYVDHDFPTNKASLVGGLEDDPYLESFVDTINSYFKWVRPEEIFKGRQFSLFEGKIEPTDIKQGKTVYLICFLFILLFKRSSGRLLFPFHLCINSRK